MTRQSAALTICNRFSSSRIFEGERTTTELLLHDGVTKCELVPAAPPESWLLPLGTLGCAILVVITVVVTITRLHRCFKYHTMAAG